MTDFNALAARFPEGAVTFRPGKVSKAGNTGYPLAYIDARDAMNRLDEVVGHEYWKDEYEFHGNRNICKISIYNKELKEWVTKSDGAADTKIEGDKGGLSDAFKRAAVKWGIGRYLYGLDFYYAPIDKWKKFTPSSTEMWKYLKSDADKGTDNINPEPDALVEKVEKKKVIDTPKKEEKKAPTPFDISERLIAKIDTFQSFETLDMWLKGQKVIDARDGVYLKDEALSMKVDRAIESKKESFVLSPSQSAAQ